MPPITAVHVELGELGIDKPAPNRCPWIWWHWNFSHPRRSGPAARAIPRSAPPPAPAPAPEPPRSVAPPAAAPERPAPVPAAQAAPAARAFTRARVPPPAAAAATVAAATPAVNDPNLLLELLPFAKLRAGGQTRRFQVLARTSAAHRDPAAFDALVMQRLLGWLAAHRAPWNSQPTSFTVNLSIATLEDERFAQKMAATSQYQRHRRETLGFEITEALCTQRRARSSAS